jgi:hypothetical protein
LVTESLKAIAISKWQISELVITLLEKVWQGAAGQKAAGLIEKETPA